MTVDRLIETLELSVRTKNCLRNLGVQTVEQLIQLTGKDLNITMPNLEKPSMNEDKVGRLMICAAKRGYILTDGANPRVLKSPHLIRVFEPKDSLLAWLKENLEEEATPSAPQQKED